MHKFGLILSGYAFIHPFIHSFFLLRAMLIYLKFLGFGFFMHKMKELHKLMQAHFTINVILDQLFLYG